MIQVHAVRNQRLVCITLILLGSIFVAPGTSRAENLLVRSDGAEYLGFDQGEGEFVTCLGSKVSYDPKTDEVTETTEKCPKKKDPDLPSADIVPSDPPP